MSFMWFIEKRGLHRERAPLDRGLRMLRLNRVDIIYQINIIRLTLFFILLSRQRGFSNEPRYVGVLSKSINLLHKVPKIRL